MNTYTFRKYDSARGKVNNPKGFESVKRSLHFYAKTGAIEISVLLTQQLHLDEKQHVAFVLHEDTPQRVYIRTADYPDDTPDIQCKLSFRKKNTFRCTNKAVTQFINSIVGATSACTLYVSPVPTIIRGKEHYLILTSSPIMVK